MQLCIFESKKGYILLTTCAMSSGIHCFELLMSNQKQMLQCLIHFWKPPHKHKPDRSSNVSSYEGGWSWLNMVIHCLSALGRLRGRQPAEVPAGHRTQHWSGLGSLEHRHYPWWQGGEGWPCPLQHCQQLLFYRGGKSIHQRVLQQKLFGRNSEQQFLKQLLFRQVKDRLWLL